MVTSIIFFLRVFLYKFVFEPIATSSGLQEIKTVKKVSESGFKICYWFPMWVWCAWIVVEGNWLIDTKECWRGFPNQPKTPSVTWFYTVQLAFYIYIQIAHVFLDVKRKDFWPMLVHHFLTIGLIMGSWWFTYFRMGMVVFFSMDFVDVIIEFAKIFKNLKWEKTSAFFFINLLFFWVFFRMGVFPYKVLFSVYSEVEAVHIEEGYFDYTYNEWWVFNMTLWALQVLQVYWFGVILHALYRLIVTGKVEDVTDKQVDKAKKMATSQQSTAVKKPKAKSS